MKHKRSLVKNKKCKCFSTHLLTQRERDTCVHVGVGVSVVATTCGDCHYPCDQCEYEPLVTCFSYKWAINLIDSINKVNQFTLSVTVNSLT